MRWVALLGVGLCAMPSPAQTYWVEPIADTVISPLGGAVLAFSGPEALALVRSYNSTACGRIRFSGPTALLPLPVPATLLVGGPQGFLAAWADALSGELWALQLTSDCSPIGSPFLVTTGWPSDFVKGTFDSTGWWLSALRLGPFVDMVYVHVTPSRVGTVGLTSFFIGGDGFNIAASDDTLWQTVSDDSSPGNTRITCLALDGGFGGNASLGGNTGDVQRAGNSVLFRSLVAGGFSTFRFVDEGCNLTLAASISGSTQYSPADAGWYVTRSGPDAGYLAEWITQPLGTEVPAADPMTGIAPGSERPVYAPAYGLTDPPALMWSTASRALNVNSDPTGPFRPYFLGLSQQRLESVSASNTFGTFALWRDNLGIADGQRIATLGPSATTLVGDVVGAPSANPSLATAGKYAWIDGMGEAQLIARTPSAFVTLSIQPGSFSTTLAASGTDQGWMVTTQFSGISRLGVTGVSADGGVQNRGVLPTAQPMGAYSRSWVATTPSGNRAWVASMVLPPGDGGTLYELTQATLAASDLSPGVVGLGSFAGAPCLATVADAGMSIRCSGSTPRSWDIGVISDPENPRPLQMFEESARLMLRFGGAASEQWVGLSLDGGVELAIRTVTPPAAVTFDPAIATYLFVDSPLIDAGAGLELSPRLRVRSSTLSQVGDGCLNPGDCLSGLCSAAACQPSDGGIVPPPVDAGTPDAGRPDAGPPDAGPNDAGLPDAGIPDGGPPMDAGTDAGVDAGADAGAAVDAGTDAGVVLDAGPSTDAGSSTDAGDEPRGPGNYGVGCGCSTDFGLAWTAVVLLFRRRATATSRGTRASR